MLAWPPYIIQDIWAKMLEDNDYTAMFFAANRQRLTKQFEFTTQILYRQGIPFYKNV